MTERRMDFCYATVPAETGITDSEINWCFGRRETPSIGWRRQRREASGETWSPQSLNTCIWIFPRTKKTKIYKKKMEIWQETWFDTLSCDNNGGKNFHGLKNTHQIEEMSPKREKLAINMIDLKAVDFSSQNVWNLQLPISYPSSQHHFHRQRSFARVQKSSENANSQHQVQSTASTEIWHFCFVC